MSDLIKARHERIKRYEDAQNKVRLALIDFSLSVGSGFPAYGHCILFGDELIALQELSSTPIMIDEPDDDTHDYRLGITVNGTTKDGKKWAIRLFSSESVSAVDTDEDSHRSLDCRGWKLDQDPKRFVAALLKTQPVVEGKIIRRVEWMHCVGGIEVASGELPDPDLILA